MRRWTISIRLPGGGPQGSSVHARYALRRANRGAEYDLRAKELLAEAANDDKALAVLNNHGVSLPHEHVFHMLWTYMWPIWHAAARVPPPVPRADIHHCVSPYRQEGRGVDTVEEGWCGKRVDHYRWYPWSNFYSEDCRICSLCESLFSSFWCYP